MMRADENSTQISAGHLYAPAHPAIDFPQCSSGNQTSTHARLVGRHDNYKSSMSEVGDRAETPGQRQPLIGCLDECGRFAVDDPVPIQNDKSVSSRWSATVGHGRQFK
jgi:hypothetical protein